jgi:hypothetical protein
LFIEEKTFSPSSRVSAGKRVHALNTAASSLFNLASKLTEASFELERLIRYTSRYYEETYCVGDDFCVSCIVTKTSMNCVMTDIGRRLDKKPSGPWKLAARVAVRIGVREHDVFLHEFNRSLEDLLNLCGGTAQHESVART